MGGQIHWKIETPEIDYKRYENPGDLVKRENPDWLHLTRLVVNEEILYRVAKHVDAIEESMVSGTPFVRPSERVVPGAQAMAGGEAIQSLLQRIEALEKRIGEK